MNAETFQFYESGWRQCQSWYCRAALKELSLILPLEVALASLPGSSPKTRKWCREGALSLPLIVAGSGQGTCPKPHVLWGQNKLGLASHFLLPDVGA